MKRENRRAGSGEGETKKLDLKPFDPPPPRSRLLSPLSQNPQPRPQSSRDYAIACANEASMALAARKGKKMPTMGYRKPRATDDSFHKMWFSPLQWKAWRLDRQGGGYTPRF